ncbi:MAG: UvrD-helicase domain-containing protein [Leptospirillia bacterium]
MNSARPFAPKLRRGVTLIEASAGTGKTFALTQLYLAAVLSGVSVEQILVVTFTEAATAELRGRLRTLLSRARETALGVLPSPEILPLVADVRPEHLALLSRALFDFDRAPVATIHSFCRRILREYAFEFDAPFSLELESSDRSYKKASVREVWRQLVYREDPRIVWQISGIFPQGPDDLLTILPPGTLSRAYRDNPGIPPLEASREVFLASRGAWIAGASTLSREAVDRWLDSFPGSGKNGRVLAADRKKREALALRILELATPYPLPPAGTSSIDGDLERVLRDSSDGGPPELASLRDFLKAAFRISSSLCERFRREVHRELSSVALKKRERQGVETFDDMIGRVVAGLSGPKGEALGRLLRERFPVAFVDEFQDTDYAQFAIFGRIYDLFVKDSPGETSLVLVGDPKQSIYRFRGADLEAYVEAREAVLKKDAEGVCSLQVNYRSDALHVEAVNTLFSRHPDPFLSRGAIPYLPVRAHKTGPSDFLDEMGEKAGSPPILFALEPERDSFNHKDFVDWAAREILRLLAGPVSRKGAPLRPDDICLLVRTNSHANMILTALEALGIPAVSYAGGSVLRGEMAFDLEMLLLALKDPGDRRQMRLVLSSSLFGASARELLSLEDSPELWNARVDPFFRTAAEWFRLGAMGALRRLCLETGVFSRILGGGAGRSGRRRLTDLFHLLEWVESLDRDRPPLALLVDRYLEARRESEKKGDDTTAPRLDTLDGRVRILTIHRAKGLEFPVVILPLGLSGGELSSDDKGEGGEDEAEDAAESESPEEMMRLLYVALTRAVHRTVIMVPCRYVSQSSLARLLFGSGGGGLRGGRAVAFFQEEIARLVADHPALFGTLSPPDRFQKGRPSESLPALLPPRSLPRPLPPPLRVESFSSLSGGGRRDRASFLPGREDDDLPWDRPAGDPSPGGPLFGTVFHRTFEILLSPASPGEPRDLFRELPQALDQALAENASDLGGTVEDFREALWPLCGRTLKAGLFPDPAFPGGWFAFERIAVLPRSVEREFLLPVGELFDRDLRPFLFSEGMPLVFDPVRGMVRGFVDLLFRQGEKTYLLDYKTNRLPGESQAEAYGPEGLSRAMAQHRYDLQGLLYNLALHRLLAFSRPDYDYERHFGGALFLFVRGAGEQGEGVVHLRPDRAEIEALSAVFSGEGR